MKVTYTYDNLNQLEREDIILQNLTIRNIVKNEIERK